MPAAKMGFEVRALAVTSAMVGLFVVFVIRGDPTPPPTAWKIVGWNNLGMHCMDSDYGVFSILPPYNVVDAQVIQPDGHLLTSATGYSVTYEAVADPSGSINRTSIGKTNFWQHVTQLYGSTAGPDMGLAGFDMPGPANVPQSMAFSPASHVFTADGVPIAPYDDAGHERPYPMMRVTLRSPAGAALASADVVLPVSDEMDCRLCHASGAPPAAQPAPGWTYDPNPERDYRLNVLRRHDERLGSAVYDASLATAGYSAGGLYDTVVTSGTPILCARCHASNALPGTGIAGISALTSAVHAGHADAVDPLSGLSLDQSQNRAACYRCHPGSETRCLRGAMGSAVAPDGSPSMQCQSCHGSMSVVGNPARVGWLEEPSCQNCHTGNALVNSGQIRYTNAFLPNGQFRQPADPTFATNPDTPAAGFDLYRFSTGHGGLRCEACHGSTHAEYPALHPNDNVQSQFFQGHAGVIAECGACHATNPETANGGPHGLHPMGQWWVDEHHDFVDESGPMNECRICHGADLKGTVLSLSRADRGFSTNWGTKTYFRGSLVSCYGCHDGPDSSDPPNNQRGIAQDATLSAALAPVQVTLVVNDPDAGQVLSYRIVSQPVHGAVSLAGNQATYFPEAGYAGPDPFTFAAFDGYLDSTLGTVTVIRGAGWNNYGSGYPGNGGVVPAFVLSAAPQLGSTVFVYAQNTSGAPAPAFVGVSADSASLPSALGGVILVEPTSPIAIILPAGGLYLQWPIPNDPALTGVVLHAQVVQADSQALFGWAFSRGLRIVFGP